VFTVLHKEQQEGVPKFLKLFFNNKSRGKFYQDRQFTYDVTLKRLHITFVAVEKAISVT